MCFRPPAATAQFVECPECGKKVNAVMGNIPNVCPFCEADLTAVIAEFNAASQAAETGAEAAPAAPVAPTAPGAPEAPKPPQP